MFLCKMSTIFAMTLPFHNIALGGYRFFVVAQEANEARALLANTTPADADLAAQVAPQTCFNCGSTDIRRPLQFSWLLPMIYFDIPVWFPRKRRYCADCGADQLARSSKSSSSAARIHSQS